MTRSEVTALILAAKLKKKLSWAQLAEVLGQSKEWSPAALLGLPCSVPEMRLSSSPPPEGRSPLYPPYSVSLPAPP